MWYAHEGMGWWMVFGGILWVMFWVGVIALVVWAIRSLVGHGSKSSSQRRDALDIARERYARGEITKEQFDQIKKDLS